MELTVAPEERKATFILFSSTKKLTHLDLKKTFRVKKGKLFPIKRKHFEEGELFNKLNAVRASKPNEGMYFNFNEMNVVTHIYVVDQHTCTKDFAILKYGPELLGGFDVCPSALEELSKLLEAYREIASFCGHGRYSLDELHQRSKAITNSAIQTSSKFTDLLTEAVESFEGFTQPILSLARGKVDEWFEAHYWKDVYSAVDAVDDKHKKTSGMNSRGGG